MNRAPRCEVFLVATSLICAAAIGCHRQNREVEETLAAARRSYEPLGSQIAQLHGTLTGLHKGADEIAAAVPGGQEFRMKLLATDEVLGVADARTKWLGAELDEAAKTGNEPAKKKEDVAELNDQIAKTAADLAQVSTAALDLTHEKARLERVGALLKAPYERTLPGGFRVKAATSGIEAGLIDFIQGHKKVDNATWFDFDRLQFFPDGADIDFPNSRDQLQNVVEILKAYPKVKLKVGGYTDSGPPARNKKLSTDRAEAVRTALIQMGVTPPARLTAQGYGAEHPICPANDSEFCRAQNRRIAVQVTALAR